MSTSTNSKLVKCPFYRRDELRAGRWYIGCDGLAEKQEITLTYYKQDERDQQMKLFCECRYECCEIYRIIMEARYPDG